MPGFFEKLLTPFEIGFKKSIETFIDIETADDKTSMASVDGSIVSYIKVDGSRQIIGQEEYEHLIEAATIKIGARFDRQGHAMQVFFVRDPSRVTKFLKKKTKPVFNTSRNIELNVTDLLEERVRHLSDYVIYEEMYFVLWTRPSVLTKSEYKRALEDRKKREWFTAPRSQFPLAAIPEIRNRHKSFVSAVLSSLNELGISCELLESHDAMRCVRNNLFPEEANDTWKPCLPGDPIPPRAPMDKKDMSDVVWPTLREQLSIGDARVLNDSVVRIGNYLWAGGDMTLGPMEASPFPQLLNRLFEADIPYRISFLIEGGGAYSTQFRAFIATILGVTNPLNKQIKYSLEGLQVMARSEPVVRLRVSFATWAYRDQMRLVQDRHSVLLQAIESWGYCQVSHASGDTLDTIMSSAMGIHCRGTAPPGIAPMYEVMKLIPWQRPSSPFRDGALLFRTPDGKLWPYQTGTNLTTTWFDLIFAQPGAGKSVLMNSMSLGTILSPGLSKMPFIAIIDIGPSSSGLISLIKEALPENRHYEAMHYKMQLSPNYAVNPFDTQLGCRYPMMDERSYLIELLTLLCTPPGHKQAYDGIQQLAGFVVDEMYRWRDDDQASAEPRPYLPRVDYDIDEVLRRKKIVLPEEPYWWDVVEKLFDVGETHMAQIAQRHAVPTLTDAITAARRPQIRTLLSETKIGVSTESVINAFERMITSAIREFPILASVTRFDVSDSRICALDLMDVSPQGDDTADRQTSIMYMLARYILVRNWWVGTESIEYIPEKFKQYHELKLQDIGETPKRLCYDEYHRTSKSASVRAQLIRDVREGRKRGVQIVLASQLLDDFDEDMVDLATGIWVCGAAISDTAVDDVQKIFGLSQTARDVIRFRLTGPKAGGAPVLFVLATTEGRYEQHLINTLGPIEIWALSTSSEDVAVRSRLYKKLGARRARQMLAANFPGGSARGEIKRRVFMRADQEGSTSQAVSEIIEEIVQELIEASQTKLVAPEDDEDEDEEEQEKESA